MEDAYNELYREFVHLRSICIRQAALLQKLSRELHKQQGSNGCLDKDGSVSGMEAGPDQCSQGSAHTQDSIPSLVATNQDASPHTDVGHPHTAGVTPLSALLVADMEKLGLNVPHPRQTPRQTNKEREESSQPASPALSLASSLSIRGADSYEVPHRDETRVIQPYGTTRQLAWPHNPLLDSDALGISGAFMSEVELQSQVCEFCYAIFPGHTATRGEFLRHLHTHIT